MLIGSSGRFEAHFTPVECGRRLNQDRNASSHVGHADVSGFQLARYGRTAVRIRGTFTPSTIGCEVRYRVEFIPAMLWALVAAFAVSIPVLMILIWLGYVPMSTLALLFAIVVVVLPLNLWFSERQAGWLKDYLVSVLDLGRAPKAVEPDRP
jgi:hypothetical protein